MEDTNVTYRVGQLENDVKELKTDVKKIATNDLPHIQADMKGLATQAGGIMKVITWGGGLVSAVIILLLSCVLSLLK